MSTSRPLSRGRRCHCRRRLNRSPAAANLRSKPPTTSSPGACFSLQVPLTRRHAAIVLPLSVIAWLFFAPRRRRQIAKMGISQVRVSLKAAAEREDRMERANKEELSSYRCSLSQSLFATILRTFNMSIIPNTSIIIPFSGTSISCPSYWPASGSALGAPFSLP